ncbi:MAG: efflux RND transporter periplasmic adaptor subunit [Verrucomicrobiota bacterium]
MPSTHTPEKPETLKQPDAGTGGRQRHPLRWILLFLGVAGIAYWYYPHAPAEGTPPGGKPGAGRGQGGRGGMMVVPVVAGTVAEKDVPIYLEGLGTVQGLNSVTIHSRVDGQLTHIAFTEGQNVRAGDVLAKIDPAPFQAQLAQSEAKKRQDEALLANARSDLERYTEMLARKAASQQQYDTQKSLVAQYEAAVGADQAAIQSARVQLDYTTLVSPIDGRAGIRLIDNGNIVHASDAGGLVVVTQLRPISVVFTLPEQNLPEVRKQMAKGDLTVFAMDRDEGPPLGKGVVAVYDNQIDTTTGTVKLKATFPNDDLALWPGQFVNARLLLTTRKAGIVVPAAVIQRGPSGSFAFVIAKGSHAGPEDLTVELRPVKVAQIEDGEALIDEGLKPGERVVVEGQYRLQAHSRVRIEKSAAIADGDDAQ